VQSTKVKSERQVLASAATAAGLLFLGLLVGGAVGIFYLSAPRSVTTTDTTTAISLTTQYQISIQHQTEAETQTRYVTSTQHATAVQNVTVTSTYVPTGRQNELLSAAEVIPSGYTSVTLPSWSLAYYGYLEVSYNATNLVSLSYVIGSTTITTPNSAAETNLIIPILTGNPQIKILNDECSKLGCPSINMNVTVTYYY